MTISSFKKAAVAVAILGTFSQVQAAGEDDHVHAVATTSTSSTTSMGTTNAMADPLANLAANVKAGKISGGAGVNYVGRFTFDNAMVKVDMAKGKYGEELSITNSPNGLPGFSEVLAIAPTKSMGWNDPASNPDLTAEQKKTANFHEQSFGWGHNSRWHLVDLSKLAAGSYYVSIKVERYDDGVATKDEAPITPAVLNADGSLKTAAVYPTMSDDDLVPALTVWDGYQNQGTHSHWFPNKNQETKTVFWAQMLKFETTLAGMNNQKKGFDTSAHPTAINKEMAQVSGIIKLDPANKGFAKTNRYLTIALGGDDRTPFLADGVTSAKHDVNYKLTVKVHKK